MIVPPSPSGDPRRGRTLAVFLLSLAAGLMFYFLIGPVSGGSASTPAPYAYYGLLTDALLSGQLHLKTPPDPALKLLENPWAGHQGVPRLHDATYFQNRYYLYFSAVPALLVCAPWKLLSGEFLSDGAITAVCAALALVFAGIFWLGAWRRWFPSVWSGWLAVGVLLLTLASGLPSLVVTHSVYSVPISAAVACSMAAWVALGWALTADRPSVRLTTLGLASLAWGLAVACRPNYLFSLAALGGAVLWLTAAAARQQGLFSRAALATAAAGIGPAAVVGVLMAAYNYSRFGSFTEFGTTYMFAAQDQRFMDMVGYRYLWDNLHIYFAQPAVYGPYFPYLTGSGVGVLPGVPLALLGLLWPMTLLHPPFRRNPAWIILGVALLLTFLLNVIAVSLLPTGAERYRADFLPAGILLGLFSACGLIEWLRNRPSRSRLFPASARLLLGLVVAWTLSHSVLLALVHNPRPEMVRPLALAANRLTSLVERAQGREFGAATLRVSFPAAPTGRREPLVVSGAGQDILYVWYSGENEIRLGFHHVGAGGPVSAPFKVVPGREYELEINLGSFYPPSDHPAFADWPAPQVKSLRRQLIVTLDNVRMLNGGSEFYPSYPADIHFGENPGPYVAPGRFSGLLRLVRRHGIPAPLTLPGTDALGPMRLTLRLPEFRHFHTEPLVSTGHDRAGDLLYVSYVAPGLIRFGHDSWNAGAIETATVAYEPGKDQILELEMPAFSPPTGAAPTGRLVLRYNGMLLLADDRPVHRSESTALFLGFNGSDSTAAAMNFSGEIARVEQIPPLTMSTDQFQLGTGPVRLGLRFPSGAAGRNEPLLVTGRTGQADIIYVQYVDDAHVRIGYDHWMKGGPVSALIPVDYAANHTLEIRLGSLFPPEGDPGWGATPAPLRAAALDTVTVSLNGRTVLEHAERAYRSEPAEILAGLNPIGASTCSETFTGRIFLQERLGLPAAP